MSRPVDTRRRAELLEAAAQYAALHGLAALSLRPLAKALGTSDRMLVHYFGTKENLIGQILSRSRPPLAALLDAGRPGRGGEGGVESAGGADGRDVTDSAVPVRVLAEQLWHNLGSGGEQETSVRLLLQAMALGLTTPEPYGRFTAEAVHAWVQPVSQALEQAGRSRADAEARATALVSGLRGLALDRWVTGDRQRTDEAAGVLIAAMTA